MEYFKTSNVQINLDDLKPENVSKEVEELSERLAERANTGDFNFLGRDSAPNEQTSSRIYINDDNYEIFLENLCIDEEPTIIPEESFIEEVYNYLETVYKSQIERNRVRVYFGDDSIESKLTQSDIKRVEKMRAEKNILNTPEKSIDSTEKWLKVGYALLNLEIYPKTFEHLKEILKKLNKNAEKSHDQLEFETFLWKNIETYRFPEDFMRSLIELCPYFYEKILIEAATNTLKGEKLPENFSFLLTLCTKYKKLYFNAMSIIYELYYMSDFNEKVVDIAEDIGRLYS